MSKSHRSLQIEETIAHLAADFFAREAVMPGSQALITVTHADVSPDLRNTTIFFSVLPERYEKDMLAFAKRERTDFRDYLKSHTRLGHLPTVDFEIDYGEKNRQRIDALTRKKEAS